MFRSCGFFKSFPCQFYVNGLCERPYCHFKHSKHDVERAKEDAPSGGAENVNHSTTTASGPSLGCSSPVDSSLTAETSKVLPQTSGPIEAYFSCDAAEANLSPSTGSGQEQDTGSFAIPSFTDNSCKYQVPIAEEPEQYSTASPERSEEKEMGYSTSDSDLYSLPTYLPTPKTPSLPAPQPVKDDCGVPVYQPTPKRQLKRQHNDQGKKGKTKGTDLEYDPEKNFTCGGLVKNSLQDKGAGKTSAKVSEYQPTEKKARLSSLTKKRRRLSCDSMMGSPQEADCLENEDVPDAQFSEEESQSDSVKQESEAEKGVKVQLSESFENIGDADISSDDDFVDVPEEPQAKFNPSNQQQLKDKSSPRSVLEKTKSKKKSAIQNLKKKRHVAAADHGQTSSSKASGLSSSKLKSKQSSTEKTVKLKRSSSSSLSSDKKSSTEKTGKMKGVLPSSSLSSSSSSSRNTTKHPSSGERSSSAGTVSNAEKTQQLSKHHSRHNHDSAEHGSKTSVSLLSNHKSKGDSKNSHALSKSSSKRTPSDKPTSSKKTLDSNKHSHAVRESVSSDAKQLSSSSNSLIEKRSSSSSSVKGRLNAGKVKTTSNTRSPSSDGHSFKLDHNKTSHEDKLLHGDKKSSSASKSSSSEKKISHSLTSSSAKDSNSSKHSSKGKQLKSSESRPSSKGDRRSSSDRQKVSHGEKTISSKSTSGKPSKLMVSSHEKEAQKHPSSSGKHSGSSEKVQKADSSWYKELKDNRHQKRLSTDSKKGGNTLVRMNSDLFGEDSDNELVEVAMDVQEEVDVNDAFEEKHEEDDFEDYSGLLNESDFEEEDTFDECLRIFQENPPPKKTASQQEKKLTKDAKKEAPSLSGSATYVPGRKRTAYQAAGQSGKGPMKKKARPRHVPDPSEVMHNRIMEMQRKALERAAKQAVQEQEVSSTSGSLSARKQTGVGMAIGGEKKRVAHLPKPVAKTSSVAIEGNKKITLALTASKTEKRVAHTPNLTNLKRPVIPASFGSKVPSNIRQRYLNLIIDECLKFCPNEEKAFKKGLEEESGVYERASNKNIYLRVAVNTITRLRSEARESAPGSSSSLSSLGQRSTVISQSHEATLGGSRAAKTSFTLHRSAGAGKKVEVVLTELELYQKLLKYTLNEQQLDENGYPKPCKDSPGKVTMQRKRYQDTDTLLKDNERTCARCGKRFIVNADGSYVRSEECVYHWTRAYPRKKAGFIQQIYNCCNSDTSSKGCQVASNHVHDRNKWDNLTGFMRTLPRSPPRDGNYGIYALDCEMVYTQAGLELARVTVVDTEGESVFESLVQPFSAVVDYNTRFSGLTAADLKGVKTTLTDVQAILLSRFSEKTILIGHSLESDLCALKLIHFTVVDTSVAFPHRLGPPYKRALKNLMLETFQKIIQADDGGHDSKEDAVACLQLMKWRIKEDSKREARYSRD